MGRLGGVRGVIGPRRRFPSGRPVVSDRVAVQHKNTCALAAEVAASSLPTTGREGRRLRSADRTRRRISTPADPPLGEFCLALALSPAGETLSSRLCVGDVSVYELIMPRQVGVASGGLCERKEFSRRMLPLCSAERLMERAPSIYYSHGYAVLLGIVHRMLPWHLATQALDSTVTFLNTIDCQTGRNVDECGTRIVLSGMPRV